MNNPHVQDFALSYLAGIIDGEGTITLERSGNRRLCGVMGLSPRVIITNTNEQIIQYCVNLFRLMGVTPYIKTQDVGYKTRRKKCYWVCVSGLSKCKKVLEPLIRYLVGKETQARLVLDFIKLRGLDSLNKGKPYGEEELIILDKIRALNFRGTSETEDYGIRNKIVQSK